MKKKEFFKKISKENKGIVTYYIYTTMYSILLIGSLIFNQFCIKRDLVSLEVYLVVNIFIIVLGVVGIIIDLRQRNYLNKMFKSYQNDGQFPEYKFNLSVLKIIVCVYLLLFVFFMGFALSDYEPSKKVKPIDIKDSVLSITTKEGRVIDMEYIDYGKFAIKVPKEFDLMSDEDRELKYPLENRPSVVYTNEDASINIAYSTQGRDLKNEDVSLTIEAMEQLYGKAFDILGSEVIEKDGHSVGYIKFVSPAIDTNVYNHFMVISVDGKAVIMSFNCIEKYMNEWTDVGEFILKSIIFE